MSFTIPAKYAPFVADMLQRAIEEARLDEFFRADTDPRVQRFASVPDALIDDCAVGEVLIEVASPHDGTARTASAATLTPSTEVA